MVWRVARGRYGAEVLEAEEIQKLQTAPETASDHIARRCNSCLCAAVGLRAEPADGYAPLGPRTQLPTSAVGGGATKPDVAPINLRPAMTTVRDLEPVFEPLIADYRPVRVLGLAKPCRYSHFSLLPGVSAKSSASRMGRQTSS